MKNPVTTYVSASIPKSHPFPLVSWLIRIITLSDTSHVFYSLPIMNKVFHVYFNNIRYEGPEYLETVTVKYKFQIDTPKEYYLKMVEYFDSIQGKRWGYYLQLVGIALTLPFRLLRFNLHNPFRLFYTSMTCSEMMVRSLIYAGLINVNENIVWKLENWTEKDMVRFLDYLTDHPSDLIKVKRIK